VLQSQSWHLPGEGLLFALLGVVRLRPFGEALSPLWRFLMPKHQRLVGLPMGSFRADPLLGRVKKEGPARGHNAKEQDRRIALLVAKERAKQDQR
jgi:hypothetical protein